MGATSALGAFEILPLTSTARNLVIPILSGIHKYRRAAVIIDHLPLALIALDCPIFA